MPSPTAKRLPMAPTPCVPAAHVKAVRSFNRFYTQRIGVLDPYLGSPFSLTEVRVLYELAHRDQPTATELARDLALDAGYLSRILRRFEAKGWLARVPSPADGRQSLLQLTPSGHNAFAPLQQKSRDEATALLGALSGADQQALLDAMATVQRLMDPASATLAPSPAAPLRTAVLREVQPGDMGWVVQQHGAIYAREYGWNQEFEGLVAGIVGEMIAKAQPDWERGWMVDIDHVRVGSAFVVRKSKTVAQLRLLILTADARGLGLGARLTDECIAFARSKGYKKMVLWTNACLTSARAIYARRGFALTDSAPYSGYGHDLVSETWELHL